jgi:hypothetical protein
MKRSKGKWIPGLTWPTLRRASDDEPPWESEFVPESLEECAGEKQLCKLIERYRRSDPTRVTRRAG